ncbi:MAG TPA: hypothetical protein VKX28_27055 [Xanthobacteraceae bacterium]|nr:hypothetical protein [Xanthobacteraceae bacterium]
MVREKGRLALLPATDIDRERLRSIRCFEPMQVQTIFARTSKLNRWYRGLLGKVAEAIDVHPDLLHAELKWKAGLVLQIMAFPSGEVAAIAVRLKSTAFPLMDDAEFSRYVDVAVELLFRDYLPHVRSRQRKALIAEWAGRRPRLDPPGKPFLY